MLRIVISGGIGSGKSAVTSILREMGAKVVLADEINAALLTEPSYIKEISNRFPTAVHNNVINKKELAEIIYRNEGKRKELMSLSHPIIFERMFSLYPEEKVVFYEVPLLSESDISFDRIWYVDASLENRVRRIVGRDGVSEAYAERIISLQKMEELFLEKADVVIRNDGDMEDLRGQVKTQYCYILREFS